MSINRILAIVFPGLIAIGAQFGTAVYAGAIQSTLFICYLILVGCSGLVADWSIFMEGVE